MIDGFRWLLGTEVSEVFCNLATHVRERRDEAGTRREVTTDDEANLVLRFADGELTAGATGNVSLSMVEPGNPEHRLEIFGSRGALASMQFTNSSAAVSPISELLWSIVERGTRSRSE